MVKIIKFYLFKFCFIKTFTVSLTRLKIYWYSKYKEVMKLEHFKLGVKLEKKQLEKITWGVFWPL